MVFVLNVCLCSIHPCRWRVGADFCPLLVWGFSGSCAGSGSPLPPFQMTRCFPWRPWMHLTEEPFSLRVLSQRWSLPPWFHTEDQGTATVAVTRSCPFSSGGAVGCSHIFQATLSALTVPRPPVWSRAIVRYPRYLPPKTPFMNLLPWTGGRCMYTLIIISFSGCSATNLGFDLERCSYTNGQHLSSFMGQTSGHMRHLSLVSATKPGHCSTKSHL